MHASYTAGTPFFLVKVEDEPSVLGAPGEITPEDVQKVVQWVCSRSVNICTMLEEDQSTANDIFRENGMPTDIF